MMEVEDLVEWFKSLPVDRAEWIKQDFAVAIDQAAIKLNLSRKQLAEKLGTSPAWVTKVLRGDVNLTIESMVKLCEAVDCELTITINKKRSTSAEPKRLRSG